MRILLLFFILIIAGCVSTKSSQLMISKPIAKAKVIAVQGTRAPWVFEIERRLKKQGFEIKRMASQGIASTQVSDTTVKTYRDVSASYVLLINGFAPNNAMTRCFGGGYRFEFINVELIDIDLNETVAHYSNSGYSENCPPMSGSIFADITSLIASAWE